MRALYIDLLHHIEMCYWGLTLAEVVQKVKYDTIITMPFSAVV